jgi:RimJ/RimL family protein N-acetyltransferase
VPPPGSTERLPEIRIREATEVDVPAILGIQEPGAVQGLGHIFPQDEHPFPREAVEVRWRQELADPTIAVYVAIDALGRVTGFAARQGDQLLHFGTAIETWGSGLAQRLHDELLESFPASVTRLRLRVFAENRRARRFYEKLGWVETGAESRTQFPPHPVLLEYARARA